MGNQNSPATFSKISKDPRSRKEQNVPVEAVDVEHFCDPHQRCDVVESIVYKQEKPKVYLDSRFSVTWYLVPIIQFE
jgi:hypothetical protein